MLLTAEPGLQPLALRYYVFKCVLSSVTFQAENTVSVQQRDSNTKDGCTGDGKAESKITSVRQQWAAGTLHWKEEKKKIFYPVDIRAMACLESSKRHTRYRRCCRGSQKGTDTPSIPSFPVPISSIRHLCMFMLLITPWSSQLD